jgi:hypothetical protein
VLHFSSAVVIFLFCFQSDRSALALVLIKFVISRSRKFGVGFSELFVSAVHAALAGYRSCRILDCVRQRGSNCGSITGPIHVASGCFPLSNVLMGFAKLFRLRRF